MKQTAVANPPTSLRLPSRLAPAKAKRQKTLVKVRLRERTISVAVIGLCMLGVTLISRLYLAHKSLRLDESQSLWQSSHSISGLLKAVASDVHVPLYHLMLHYWIFYFGDNVPTIRLLSLIFFLLSIPVVYLIARQLLTFRWALFTTVLFSFSPFMNWYANEARMYTLLALFSLLSMYFFLRIINTGKGWFWFGLVAVIGAYSHYFFLFTLLSEGIYFLINRRKFPPRSFRKLFIIGSLVVLALLPWLIYFHSLGSASNTRPHLPQPSTIDFSNVYSQFLFGFQTDRINTVLLSLWPIAMLVALLAVRRNKSLPPALGFLAFMAVIPVLLAYLLSLAVTPFFLSRYMVSCTAPLFIVAVWLFSQYSKRATATLAVLIAAGTVISSFQQDVSANTPVREDYRGVASDINAGIKPQDLVVLSTPYTIYPFEYYYSGSAQIATLPAWNRTTAGGIPAFNPKTLASEVTSQNQNHRYIYLVLSQNQGYQNTIKNYYITHFKQISKKTYSPDLTLYVFQVGYYTVPPIAQAGPKIKID